MNDEVTQRYARLAALHGEATGRGDSRTANAAYDDLNDVFQTLHASGKLGKIVGLLDDEDDYVRLWAASHLLLTDERRAKRTLKALRRLGGIAGFDAEMVLKEWRKGRLSFPVTSADK